MASPVVIVDVVIAVNEVIATAATPLCATEVLMATLRMNSGSLHPSARTIEGGRRQGQGGNQQEDKKLQHNKSYPGSLAHFRMTLKGPVQRMR